jgi:glutamate racemase
MFRKILDSRITLVSQNEIVAKSLSNYLLRHPEMDKRLSKNSTVKFFTTDDSAVFDRTAAFFLEKNVKSETVEIF